MNQIAARPNNAVAALSGLRKGIQNVQTTLIKRGGDPLLRLLKTGEWVYGQDDVEVEDKSLWAINPLSLQHGWSSWKRGEGSDNSGGPLGESLVSLSAPIPSRDSLPVTGHDWTQTFSVQLVCLNGTDKGTQVTYKTNSVGGVNAIDELLRSLGAQIDSGSDKIVPVVSLLNDSYKHKTYGKVVTPVLKIVDWHVLSDQMPVVDEPGDAGAEKAQDSKRPTTAPEPEPEDEVAALERQIAAAKAKKDAVKAAAATTAVDEKARRAEELRRQLAELEGGDGQPAQPEAAQAAAPAPGQPMRRRRSAA